MRYFCLCCDYDGTIARDGRVAPSTIEALKRVRASGRRLVLATGRELNDLLGIFPEMPILDRVVAENGALLYRPGGGDQKVLADPPRASSSRNSNAGASSRFPWEAALSPRGTPTKLPFST